MRKILVLFAGGTLTMAREADGALAPAGSPREILASFPQIQGVADSDFEIVCNIDSSNMQPEIWTELAEKIHVNYDSYDGFVVTHGTDTMAYTASALSFALGDLGKPVVLTGGQKPITDTAPDGVNNLVNALQVAQMDIGEVCIVFGTKILRGNRTTKESDTKLNAFKSPIIPPIGEITLQPTLYSQRPHTEVCTKQLSAYFENRIVVFQLFPGMEPAFILNDIKEKKCKGIVMLGFGPGNVPNQKRSLIPVIKAATKTGIPVLVSTQCSLRTGDMLLYEAGFDAIKAGAISALDMTDEAAITKFMWVLAQTSEREEVKGMMHTNYAGELTPPQEER